MIIHISSQIWRNNFIVDIDIDVGTVNILGSIQDLSMKIIRASRDIKEK